MTETPKPMDGTWTLIAPDGRAWKAESPIGVVAAEQRSRIPAQVALRRIREVIASAMSGDAALCELCDGTGRYGDGKHDESGRWIECPNCTNGVLSDHK